MSEEKSKNTFLIAGIIVVVILGVLLYFHNMQTSDGPKADSTPVAVVDTNMGTFSFTFHSDVAPNAVNNFRKLTDEGYFNGLTFHRVISGFMIQGGDPNCTPERASGPCGAGGPGYRFNDEIDTANPVYQKGYAKGVVAMANAGPNTNGSQFFVMLADTPLPPNYTIFGEVNAGQEVVDAIGLVQTSAGDKPVEPVVMKEVRIGFLE